MKNKFLIFAFIILVSCKPTQESTSATYKVKSMNGNEWTTKGFLNEGFYEDNRGGQVIPLGDHVITKEIQIKKPKQ